MITTTPYDNYTTRCLVFVAFFSRGKRDSMIKQNPMSVGELRECWTQCVINVTALTGGGAGMHP